MNAKSALKEPAHWKRIAGHVAGQDLDGFEMRDIVQMSSDQNQEKSLQEVLANFDEAGVRMGIMFTKAGLTEPFGDYHEAFYYFQEFASNPLPEEMDTLFSDPSPPYFIFESYFGVWTGHTTNNDAFSVHSFETSGGMSAVPEPHEYALLAVGLLAIAVMKFRRAYAG